MNEHEPGAPGAETITLGGGCFWCIEAVFQEVRGVTAVQSGYAGGTAPEPTYEQVCSGATGHAEVVRVTFDPGRISTREILEIFFSVHDPTTPDRQGADVGTQYRSAIYYENDAQEREARELIRELERDGVWRGIVTDVAPLDRFWPAEAYHHDYFRRNPGQGYCQAVIAPKLAGFRQRFADRRG
jgi:peptide-methionine (S)-S-oxide reductase